MRGHLSSGGGDFHNDKAKCRLIAEYYIQNNGVFFATLDLDLFR